MAGLVPPMLPFADFFVDEVEGIFFAGNPCGRAAALRLRQARRRRGWGMPQERSDQFEVLRDRVCERTRRARES